MSATQVQTEKPEKFLVRNQTAGYLGVIEIDHRGEEKGVNIEPYGSRWMTEDEMIATARAPRDPADNPFEEQEFVTDDPDTGQKKQFKMRPLVLETDAERYVPSNDRYVPTQGEPQAPGDGEAPPKAPPAAHGEPTPPLKTSPAPSRAVPPEASTEPESWVQPPEAPGQVLAGSLAGDDSAAPEQEAAAAPDPAAHPGERYTPSVLGAVSAPQTPGATEAVEEEFAERVDPAIGEETGAARPPAQPAPEGEYAQAEEVGSPDAPSANDESLVGG